MSRVSILIVDDNEGVRAGIRLLLDQVRSWEVCGEAVNGLDAIEKSEELKPEVVLMDISMPEMDGLSATRIIRRQFPHIRVVIVSQNDPATTMLQARDVGAEGFVGKLNLSNDLIPTLEKMLAC
jgi:DNA-binding NarL/FixJ family response regulator